VGGLIVPAPDVWQTGKGYSARRTIVSNDKCNACHAALGANPTFHAGQRNDAPTCAFCHNPNQTSSGWSANAKDFIHGIHGTGMRTAPFNWHAASAADGFWLVTYPANSCEACHLSGTYDFSGTSSAVPNLLASTVAVDLTRAAPASYTLSPYVDQAGILSSATTHPYGAGFSFAGDTGATTAAAGTTLVTSPITAACVACHDNSGARDHMSSNGGSFYEARSTAFPLAERCLPCHGSGKVASIADVHR
jgi:OmcA/MtrC family decaheme c-type cytochrome